MMKVGKMSVILGLLALATGAGIGAETECSADCQKAQIEAYFKKLSVVFREGSTEKDIDDLFTLFHDDVKYEHFEYDANFTKSKWKEAFLRNLKQGDYNAGQKESLRAQRLIYGKSHVAVDYAIGNMGEDGQWKTEDTGRLILFGFKDQKIVLVREYW